MTINSLIKRIDNASKALDHHRKEMEKYNLTSDYGSGSALAEIVRKVLENFSSETGYNPIFPNGLYSSSVDISETLYCLGDAKAHALSLIDEQNIDEIKEENEFLKTQVIDLKRGLGVYCSLIGDSCMQIFETKNQCFVIYDYDLEGYDTSVSNAIEKSGLKSVISKHLNKGESMGMYCTKICKPIRSSKICIADVTEDNSNVGLEIGLAWRYGKPVILTMNKGERKEPPSDLMAFTRVEYKNLKELEKKLLDQIISQLKNERKNLQRTDEHGKENCQGN